MNSGISSLHKILKDETRQKIISLLNEKNSLGYSELMEATKAGSTGLLNYHLKVLGSLITKNEAGQYQLTEKGKLASKLMLEFPDDDEDDYHLYKQLIWATLKQKKPNYLLTVKLLWLLSLLSFIIVLILNAVSINNLIFTWLFFVTGLMYLVLYYRNKTKTKPKRPLEIHSV
jgi:DNA-binding transcriptional ArsR family regulator